MKVVQRYPITNIPHDTYRNTTSHFRTKLSAVKDVNGYWEVGLVDIDYPKSWYNTPKHPEQEGTWSIARQAFTLVDPNFDFNIGIDSLEEIKSIHTGHGKIEKTFQTGKVGILNFGNYKITDFVNAINIKLRQFDENKSGYYRRHTGLYLDEQNLICTLFVGIRDIVVLPQFIASVLRLDIAEQNSELTTKK